MEVVAPRLFSTPRQRPPQAVQSIMGRARARHEVRCAARAVLHGSETDDSELEELSLTSECLDKEELRARKEDIGEALKWITGELAILREKDIELTAHFSHVLDKMRLAKPTRRRLVRQTSTSASLRHGYLEGSISRAASGDSITLLSASGSSGCLASMQESSMEQNTPETGSERNAKNSRCKQSQSSKMPSLPNQSSSDSGGQKSPDDPTGPISQFRLVSRKLQKLTRLSEQTQVAVIPESPVQVVEPVKPAMSDMFNVTHTGPRVTSIDVVLKGMSSQSNNSSPIDVGYEKVITKKLTTKNPVIERVRSARVKRPTQFNSDSDDVFQFGPSSMMQVSTSNEPQQQLPMPQGPSTLAPRTGSASNSLLTDRRGRPPMSPRLMSDSVPDALATRTPLRGQRSSLTSSPLLRQKWHQRVAVHGRNIVSSDHHLRPNEIEYCSSGNSVTRRSGDSGIGSSASSPNTHVNMIDHHHEDSSPLFTTFPEAGLDFDTEIVPGVFVEKESRDLLTARQSVSDSLYDLRPISPRPMPPPRTCSLSKKNNASESGNLLPEPKDVGTSRSPLSPTAEEIEVTPYGSLPRFVRKRNEHVFSSSRRNVTKKPSIMSRLSGPWRRSTSAKEAKPAVPVEECEPAAVAGDPLMSIRWESHGSRQDLEMCGSYDDGQHFVSHV